MKKILLIIALALLIFQMVVLATAIDVGSGAIDGGNYWNPQTLIDTKNPANDSGTITSVEIWAMTTYDLSNCEVAIFFLVSGTNYSTRDTHTIGSVTAGSKQTFSGLSLDVQTGDYIGIYFSAGYLERNDTGVATYYVAGDHIPCTNQTFSLISGHTVSLYGTGTTEEEANVIFFGTNF